MALSERKDFGVRLAFEKGRKSDEGITRSQLQPGNNIYFDYLTNWDIRINALTSGNISGIRNMIAYVRTNLRPPDYYIHLDLQDETAIGSDPLVDAHNKQFFGTAVFQDVYHNWNLPSKDHFTYSIEDLRDNSSPSVVDFSAMQSLPHVVGVDANHVRIWATNPMHLTRFDPRLWVDVDGSNLMQNTVFPSRSDDVGDDNPYRILNQGAYEIPPFYAIKIYEITDMQATVNQKLIADEIQ